MKIKIDAYYDITCDGCRMSWSTDFDAERKMMGRYGNGGMGMATNKAWLSKAAYQSGWKCKGGKTLCPECLKKGDLV